MRKCANFVVVIVVITGLIGIGRLGSALWALADEYVVLAQHLVPRVATPLQHALVQVGDADLFTLLNGRQGFHHHNIVGIRKCGASIRHATMIDLALEEV